MNDTDTFPALREAEIRAQATRTCERTHAAIRHRAWDHGHALGLDVGREIGRAEGYRRGVLALGVGLLVLGAGARWLSRFSR